MALVKCKECGEKISEKADACPKCGCTNEIIEKKKKKKRKIPIIISIIGVILIAAGALLFIALEKNKETRYIENYEEITELMVDGATDAEDVLNTCKSVWYNSIYKERDEKTDKYTMTDGIFNDDFNDSITALYDDPFFNMNILNLEENIMEVDKLYSKMRKAPKKYKDIHEDLEEFYDVYIEFMELAINPKGSLTSFSEKLSELDSNVAKLYKKTQRNLGWD